MAASTANLVFDQLFMFNAGWGIAGCGWASVVSQYMGAGLFACIIYHKRHQFGIPAALNAAAERYCQRLPKYNESKQGSYSQYPQDHQQQQQISLTGIEQQQQQPYQQQQQQQLGQLQHPPPSHHHLPLLSPLLSGDLHDSVEGRGNRPSVSGVRSLSSWSKFVILIASLDWHGFSNRFLALTTRGVLILSTYTSASVVAARSGTSTIAGHQVRGAGQCNAMQCRGVIVSTVSGVWSVCARGLGWGWVGGAPGVIRERGLACVCDSVFGNGLHVTNVM